MNDELAINGRLYISSRRAAKECKYTKDYVGQLARAGKVEAQLVGRSWYVDSESIHAHKDGVHYSLSQPTKPRKAVGAGIEQAQEQEADVEVDDTSVSFRMVNRTNEFTETQQTLAAAVVGKQSDSTDAQQDNIHADFSRVSPKKLSADSPLVDTDIRFEKGEPVFFADYGPLMPALHRQGSTFQGVPLPKPDRARAAPVQPAESGTVATGSGLRAPRARRFRMDATVPSADGIRVEMQRPASMRRPTLPDTTDSSVPKSARSQQLPVPRTAPVSEQKRPGSMQPAEIAALVALIAVIVLGLTYIVYELVIQGTTISLF